MKDLETIIPMLREELDKIGLVNVHIELTLQEVPIDVLQHTFPKISVKQNAMILAKQSFKRKSFDNDSITLESKYF